MFISGEGRIFYNEVGFHYQQEETATEFLVVSVSCLISVTLLLRGRRCHISTHFAFEAHEEIQFPKC